jgi:hypothetical protein
VLFETPATAAIAARLLPAAAIRRILSRSQTTFGRPPTRVVDVSKLGPEMDVSLVGDAAFLPDRVRLTPAARMRAGAIWHMQKQHVAGGFETEFRFQFTRQGGLGPGADGMAFVLQNSGPDALAGNGQAGGFAISAERYGGAEGIPQSIAVFLDTFHNSDQSDPSDNYIGVFTHGRSRKQRWPPPRLAIARKMPVRMKDGRPHNVRILYEDAVMTIALDGVQVLRTIVDLKSVTDPQGDAWIGFTASTGNGFENHDLLDWSFRPKTQVESDISLVWSTIAGEYRVALPAHLQWGANVPNPSGAPVEILSPAGIVCRDEQDANSCAPPSGSGTGSAGPGFLVPDAKPGALVVRNTNGVTEFSVNDRQGNAFADNQGFFEFRVRVGASR